MLYSKTTGGFYDPEIHGEAIPTDCVEISNERHAELLAEQSAGKVIVGDAEGLPQAVTPAAPALTWDAVRSKRNALLAASDWTQLADAPVDKDAWATYRQSLRDITETFATPDAVVWPTKPE